MKLTEQRQLNKAEQEAVRGILQRAHQKEPFSLTFPLLEPRTTFFLARSDDGKTIHSVLALIPLDESSFEVSAFTDPACRRQGYFHALWEKAKLSLPGADAVGGSVNVRFALDRACKDALPVLLSIGARLVSEETEMRCDLSDKPAPGSAFRFRRSAPSGEGVVCFEGLSPKDNRPVLRCYVMPMKDKHCYLHRIAVRKDLIGKGIGGQVFPQLLSVLKQQGFQSAALQVSASNIPAVQLYEKNGFSVSTVLRYYECSFD